MFGNKLSNLTKGQSLVEVAIIFPILLLILAGILDLGRLYFIYIALEDGVGEGAVYLSINAGCRTAADGDECADPNNAEYRARTAGGEAVDWSMAEIEIERPTPYGVGDPVKVTVRYSFSLITPIIPAIVGMNPLTVTSEATQIIITEKAPEEEES